MPETVGIAKIEDERIKPTIGGLVKAQCLIMFGFIFQAPNSLFF